MKNNSNMRLFIAINFDETSKDTIYSILKKLQSMAIKGSYTHKENLHLTLIFIGEVPVSKIDAIKASMNRIIGNPFIIILGGIGRFKREGGDIYWIGVENNSTLTSIHKQLWNELTKAGFSIENREYKPHLTLGRRVVMDSNFDAVGFSKSIPKIEVGVDSIYLMASERINGKLTYTPIYQKILKEEHL